MQWREYFFCAKKTKIMTLFNNSLPDSVASHSAILENIRWTQIAYALLCQPHTEYTDIQNRRGDELLNKVVICIFFCTEKVLFAPSKSDWTTDGRWNFWMMSFIFSGPWQWYLLGSRWCSHKPPGFHSKYLKLCSEDEQSFYGFGTTWGKVFNDNIFILGWSNP